MRTLESARLTADEKTSVIEATRVLKSDLPVSRVIVFGSKARGTGGRDSDLDLLVLTMCPVTPDLRAAVSDRLAEINLRCDANLSSVVVYEKDWSEGLVRYLLIHSEVERDGCEV
jgi:predicted nucleotidyltransferase